MPGLKNHRAGRTAATRHLLWSLLLGAASLTLASCGSFSGTLRTPPPATYTIGGTITGLTGAGLTLQNNGGNNLTIAAGATSFTFSARVAGGAGYGVTAFSQPTGPAQTCMVANGSGTVAAANVTSVQIACTTNSYTIGGTITGLTGAGLVLQNNGGNNLAVAAAAASFTFSAPVASGAGYSVTAFSQPTGPAQTCTVTNNSGTVAAANVTSVRIACVVNATGLFAYVTNQGNGTSGGSLGVYSMSANGTLVPLASPAVPANMQPFFLAADGQGRRLYVTDLRTQSIYTYAIDPLAGALTQSGQPTGVGSGAPALAIHPSGAWLYAPSPDGAAGVYAFSIDAATGALTPLPGSPFATGGSRPAAIALSPSGQFAFVSNNASGSVTTFAVNPLNGQLTRVGLPAASSTAGWLVTDTAGGHLYVMDDLAHVVHGFSIAGNGALTPLSPATFAGVSNPLTPAASPNGKFLYVPNWSTGGTVASNTASAFAIDAASGLLTAIAGSPFATGSLPSSIAIEPAGQFAYVANQTSGTISAFSLDSVTGGMTALPAAAAGVTPTQITVVKPTAPQSCAGGCTTYTIGGTISGLTGSGLVVQDNGGNNLTIAPGATGFTFTTAIPSGGSYNVSVLTRPSGPFQDCQVAGGVGIASATVASVQITCAAISTFYTLGGTVSGLAGAGGGLLLQNSTNGDQLLVNANGNFTFPIAIPSGGNYSVNILAQPSSPPQTCLVTNGAGTATSNVTAVVVQCASSPWLWMKGANSLNQNGVYGTLGVAADANTPGARQDAVSWTDAAGNLWLFGGYGYDSTGTLSELNDLWKYTISTGQWTWMGGSKLTNQNGVYGSLGVASANTIPGARFQAVGWTDASGNFWMFGGNGLGSAGSGGWMNDLWKYSGGQWTWMSGSPFGGESGSYGTIQVAAPGNIPGGRAHPVAGKDASGNFLLFGGIGFDASSPIVGELNDLWKYDGSNWTWISGSTLMQAPGVYGTKGVAAAGNVPGGRIPTAGWSDPAGNFWVFGGATQPGVLNDLWKFDGSQWTWETGSSTVYQDSIFGTQGVPAPGNSPSSRQFSGSWTDAAGNLWLFGGNGIASGPTGWLNDLWKYSGGQWAWMSGSKTINPQGLYGTQGVPGPGLVPGGRFNLTRWIDAGGNLWLLGGYGPIGANDGDLNDLWRYTPGP